MTETTSQVHVSICADLYLRFPPAIELVSNEMRLLADHLCGLQKQFRLR